MIFTSYFAKIRKFPANFIPVSISRWPPKGYEGLQCKELAPTKEILNAYKISNEPEHVKEKQYTENYKKIVLKNANFKEILSDIQSGLDEDMLDNMDADNIWESNTLHLVLVCFEKSGDFCHRNLVSEAMKEQGIPCREADDSDFVRMGLQLNFPINMEK